MNFVNSKIAIYLLSIKMLLLVTSPAFNTSKIEILLKTELSELFLVQPSEKEKNCKVTARQFSLYFQCT